MGTWLTRCESNEVICFRVTMNKPLHPTLLERAALSFVRLSSCLDADCWGASSLLLSWPRLPKTAARACDYTGAGQKLAVYVLLCQSPKHQQSLHKHQGKSLDLPPITFEGEEGHSSWRLQSVRYPVFLWNWPATLGTLWLCPTWRTPSRWYQQGYWLLFFGSSCNRSPENGTRYLPDLLPCLS